MAPLCAEAFRKLVNFMILEIPVTVLTLPEMILLFHRLQQMKTATNVSRFLP